MRPWIWSVALRAPGTHSSGRRHDSVAERSRKKSALRVHTPWSDSRWMHSTTCWFVSEVRSPLSHVSRIGAQYGHTGFDSDVRRMFWYAGPIGRKWPYWPSPSTSSVSCWKSVTREFRLTMLVGN